jgi:t-SNARE complex subunit (syntaxin)
MMTPETNTAVLLKLQELQPYIPLLARMIDKLNRAGATGGDDKARTDQLTKLNSLYSVIHNKNMKYYIVVIIVIVIIIVVVVIIVVVIMLEFLCKLWKNVTLP